MNGRQQIAQHKARIDAAFERAKLIEGISDSETRADFAKYLCVQVSGYLERGLSESLMQHARRNGSPSLQRFVESNTRNFTNANCKKIRTLLGSFDPRWDSRLATVLVDETKDAIDSLVANRHTIAHGGSVGITYARMVIYFAHVQTVVVEIASLCDPL